ncbi:MAG: DUF3341 domain-containing protein [Flavobacteriales bacterium]|nr:DUF3341 domain-containing protein [Flavobacteriales bacterium]
MFCFSTTIEKRNLIYGVFEDEEKLMTTVKQVRSKGIKIFDCYTPFPVHGLDVAMGISRTKLSVAAFMCGLTGFCLGLLLQFYTMIFDWPMIIGGKPSDYHMLPSMVPVTFECTILCTAYGLGILFFTRNKMGHGVRPDILDIRQTDDRLLIAFDTDDLDENSENEIRSIMNGNGVVEISNYKGAYADKKLTEGGAHA